MAGSASLREYHESRREQRRNPFEIFRRIGESYAAAHRVGAVLDEAEKSTAGRGIAAFAGRAGTGARVGLLTSASKAGKVIGTGIHGESRLALSRSRRLLAMLGSVSKQVMPQNARRKVALSLRQGLRAGGVTRRAADLGAVAR